MEIDYSWRYCVAFMAFVFVFGQLHELAHLTAGFIIYGKPGIQNDFDLVHVCADCKGSPYGWVETLAGPVFSYIMMWTGFCLLWRGNKKFWNLGFVLILGNLAFARIFTAAMGGGDETTELKALLYGQPVLIIKTIGFVLVTLVAFPPIFMAYKRLTSKNRLWQIIGFCVIPLCIMMPYEFVLLGKVLQAGFLAKAHFLGVSDFIYLHSLLMLLIVIAWRKTLFKLG